MSLFLKTWLPERNPRRGCLRQRAVKLLSKRSKYIPKIEDKDIKALVHELQVHQVELEMQNEELRRVQEEIEESRIKYSDLYDFAPIGYFTFSQAGEIVEVNLTGASLLGIERKKLFHRPFPAFVDPESRALFRDHRLNVLKSRERERCELKLIKKDGAPLYVSLESISVAHGRSFRIRSAVSDITELKKAQEKAETEHAFRIAIENSLLSGIAAVDLEGRQSYVNLGFCRTVGLSEEELVGRKSPFAYWPPEELDHINRAFQTIMNGKSPREGLELRFMRKNGERFDALVVSSPLKDHQGKVIGWIGTIGDITHLKQMKKELKQLNTQLEERVHQRTSELETANEQLRQESTQRKQAEEAVAAEQQRFNDVLEMLPAYVVLLTPDYHVSFANRFFRERFGESHGRRCFEYLFGRSEPCEICETYTVMKTKTPHHWEWTGPDGHIYDIYDFLFIETDGSLLIMEMGIDITERKRAEEALRAASLYTRNLIEASIDPLVTISPDGKVMDVNKATEVITGLSREQLIDTDFSNYFTESAKAKEGYREVFKEGVVRDYPLALRHTSGKTTDVLYNATVFRNEAGEIQGVFAAARDVTELKAIQKRTEATNSLLNLFVKKPTRKEYLDSVIELIQLWSGCRCVGVRVLDERDYIPYESYVGFSQEFWESEEIGR